MNVNAGKLFALVAVSVIILPRAGIGAFRGRAAAHAGLHVRRAAARRNRERRES